MLNYIPYSSLRQDERGYNIMVSRDQHGEPFRVIGEENNVSTNFAIYLYYELKVEQTRLYIHHIAFSLGHNDTSQIQADYAAAYECYQDSKYACGYLEKKYKAILNEYRQGEPGMPLAFIKNIPPFQPQLSQETIHRIVEIREIKKTSFMNIGKELNITQAKAKHAYYMYYHEKVTEIVAALQEKAKNHEEKHAVWENIFREHKSPKVRYEQLIGK